MSKRAIVKNLFLQTRSSYWFVPTVLVLLAVVASQISLLIDLNRDSIFYIWPESWETTEVDGARSTASVIAQSVLGVAGVMFSVTIVAVSFASGNFGPRLIGNFMKDRGTQWSLGILFGTFVFALMVLRAIHSGDGADDPAFEAFVPHLSLGLSMLLMGVSIITVIYYVHHIPETINVSNISAGLGKRLRAAIETAIDERPERGTSDDVARPEGDPTQSLRISSSGYIQNYDREQLTELADKHDLHVHILHGVGGFVGPSTAVVDVWSEQDLSDEVTETLCGCFVVGSTLTEDQNLLFIVQQLVEMTARALSPGVNDPYTAINCLNWLYAAQSTASLYNGGFQESPITRVWSEDVTFDQIFSRGFGQCYAYVKTDDLTSAHLATLLDRLIAEIEDPEDIATVRDFARKMD